MVLGRHVVALELEISDPGFLLAHSGAFPTVIEGERLRNTSAVRGGCHPVSRTAGVRTFAADRPERRGERQILTKTVWLARTVHCGVEVPNSVVGDELTDRPLHESIGDCIAGC